MRSPLVSYYSAFAFIFGVNWLWRCGVTASFGVFFFLVIRQATAGTAHRRDSPPPFLVGQLTTKKKKSLRLPPPGSLLGIVHWLSQKLLNWNNSSFSICQFVTNSRLVLGCYDWHSESQLAISHLLKMSTNWLELKSNSFIQSLSFWLLVLNSP